MIPQFVCVIPFRGPWDAVEVLLLERTPDRFCKAGFWQNVTGTHAFEDWTPSTALRETAEETGIEPVELFAVDYIHRIWLPRQDRIIWAPTFAARLPEDAQVVLSSEHVAYKWLPVADARAAMPRRSQRAALDAFVQDLVVDLREDEFRLWSSEKGWGFFSPPVDGFERGL